MKARRKNLESSVKKWSIRKCRVMGGCGCWADVAGRAAAQPWGGLLRTEARTLNTSGEPGLPGPWAATENVLPEWMGFLGKILNPVLYFWQPTKAARAGEALPKKIVSAASGGRWEANHSENSQMASSACTVLAPFSFSL